VTRYGLVTKQHTTATILRTTAAIAGSRVYGGPGDFKTMIIVRAVACVLLLGLTVGMATVGMATAGVADATAAPLDDAAERYRPYMIEGIGQALAGARDLRERIAARDLTGARKAWISARAGWERSEVFTAGFVPELDAQIDAWPNADSGFHAIEAKLFGANSTDVESETDALVDHLDSLHGKLRDMPLTPQGLLDGTVRLAYEVGESKADGGESRISGTSLDDMRNNVAGIDFACRTIFADALKAADGKLAGVVDQRIEQLKTIVAAPDLQRVDIPALRRSSEELVVALQSASAKLGLQRSTLEAASR
jgi:iron uptake system component EfeO